MGRLPARRKDGSKPGQRYRLDPVFADERKVSLTMKVPESFRRKLIAVSGWRSCNPGDLVVCLVWPELKRVRISDYGDGPADPHVDELVQGEPREPSRNGQH